VVSVTMSTIRLDRFLKCVRVLSHWKLRSTGPSHEAACRPVAVAAGSRAQRPTATGPKVDPNAVAHACWLSTAVSGHISQQLPDSSEGRLRFRERRRSFACRRTQCAQQLSSSNTSERGEARQQRLFARWTVRPPCPEASIPSGGRCVLASQSANRIARGVERSSQDRCLIKKCRVLPGHCSCSWHRECVKVIWADGG